MILPGELPTPVSALPAPPTPTPIPPEAIVGGALLILVLIYVGLYWRGLAAADRYAEGFVIERCPVCWRGASDRRNAPGSRLLGIPRPRSIVRCDYCRSVLREVGNRRWRYAVDRAANPELYSQLNGHVVDRGGAQAAGAVSTPAAPPAAPCTRRAHAAHLHGRRGLSVPLVECVPNFSEGRRAEVIAALVEAMRSAPVALLDVSSDPDHNRSVITFAGEPEPVAEAMFRAARVAVERIDLEQHRGVHPRMGAVDVIPFVPLRDISLHDCAALARAFGRRLADELDLPVYLYEAAALRPERVNLADVRRGGYEAAQDRRSRRRSARRISVRRGIGSAGAVGRRRARPADRLQCLPEHRRRDHRAGDCAGNSRLRRRTAVSQGAGLAGRRAAQVSMNVIDFRQTSLATIMAARCAQKRRGTASPSPRPN